MNIEYFTPNSKVAGLQLAAFQDSQPIQIHSCKHDSDITCMHVRIQHATTTSKWGTMAFSAASLQLRVGHPAQDCKKHMRLFLGGTDITPLYHSFDMLHMYTKHEL
jgi:hypothetical protein